MRASVVHPAGAHRVSLDVPHGGEQMGFVHDGRVETVLPEVAGGVLAGVDRVRVATVGGAECAGQGVFTLGNQDEMDVVGHPAVADEPQAGGAAVVGQEAKVGVAVGVGEEDVLAVVTAA